MRALTKHAIPKILADNAVTWLQEFLADPDSKTKRFRYRHTEVKDTLLEETGWKCVYCESKIGQNTPGDIEHKVPTSKEPSLHFTWDNLTVACTECNRRKNDYYEQADAFLDPYSDDVEAWLLHLGPLVYWQPGNARAELCVRMLKLDTHDERPGLFERKKDTLEKARSLLGGVQSAGGDPLMQALRTDELVRMCLKSGEYSAMVKTYVDSVLVSASLGAVSSP